jgi:hypothetical protein
VNLQYLSDSLTSNQRIWVFNATEPDVDANYQIQVFTTDLSQGAGWNKEYSVSEIPKAIKFDETNQTVSLIGNNEDVLIVLDENGDKQESLESEGGGQ